MAYVKLDIFSQCAIIDKGSMAGKFTRLDVGFCVTYKLVTFLESELFSVIYISIKKIE